MYVCVAHSLSCNHSTIYAKCSHKYEGVLYKALVSLRFIINKLFRSTLTLIVRGFTQDYSPGKTLMILFRDWNTTIPSLIRAHSNHQLKCASWLIKFCSTWWLWEKKTSLFEQHFNLYEFYQLVLYINDR